MQAHKLALSTTVPVLQISNSYMGPQDAELVQHMKSCNPKGPLVIHICKLFPKADTSRFDAFGRIYSGTVKPGDRVRILGEAYTPEDEEDASLATVTNVWLYQARYRIPVSKAAAGDEPHRVWPVHVYRKLYPLETHPRFRVTLISVGALVLLEGIDATITKTATVVPEFYDEEIHIFKPLTFQTQSVMKIACEPLNPSELPKMVSVLSCVVFLPEQGSRIR